MGGEEKIVQITSVLNGLNLCVLIALSNKGRLFSQVQGFGWRLDSTPDFKEFKEERNTDGN